MKIKIQLIVMLFMGLSFYGCASDPAFTEYSEEIPKLNAEQGRIYVYRPGTLGAVLRPKVDVDGKIVAEAVANSFFFLDLSSGEHEITILGKKPKSLKFTIEKGEKKYIRLHVSYLSVAGRINPILVTHQQGLQEISKTNYKGLQEDGFN